MHAVKVLPKGQITLPKNVRKKLGIDVGDALVLEDVKGGIMLKKGKTLFDYIGFLPKPDMPIEDMIEKATEEAIRDRV
ncbi:MAG: hypothetical protein A2X55_08940 [Nitrospirae bacterium GWB2_47_37]|nr:MAG: hypothetical protein A2X55_08940 [Nitrospirae bacterium GWB2_47_37]HAK87637.1 AbrB family transcriptional regulator [Nitrospiraceae bacterium]